MKIYSGDFSIEFLKIFKKICSWRFFPWNMVLEIFPLKNGDFSFWRFVHGDFSFGIFILEIELLKKNLVKICSWRFLLEDLFWRFFHWSFGNFYWRFVHWRFFLWNMVLEIFPFEDLFMEIFPWRFILRDFSIEVLEIFIEDLFIGEFSFGIWFWRFFLWKKKNFPFENGDFFYDHKVKKMKMD